MPQYKHRPKLRAKVRDLLRLVPTARWVTAEFIAAEIINLDPTADDADEIASVIKWLDDEGHIESRHNKELERTEWRLTELGRQRAD